VYVVPTPPQANCTIMGEPIPHGKAKVSYPVTIDRPMTRDRYLMESYPRIAGYYGVGSIHPCCVSSFDSFNPTVTDRTVSQFLRSPKMQYATILSLLVGLFLCYYYCATFCLHVNFVEKVYKNWNTNSVNNGDYKVIPEIRIIDERDQKYN
jgi:hypothetical protein